jgi:hypothetical protein
MTTTHNMAAANPIVNAVKIRFSRPRRRFQDTLKGGDS